MWTSTDIYFESDSEEELSNISLLRRNIRDKSNPLSLSDNDEPATPPPTPVVVTPTEAPKPTVSKNYTNARIQIRMMDGSTLVETFDAKEQLSAVRLFVQLKLGSATTTFGLMTSFPKKVFTGDDFDISLEKLGLVPSAVLIVTKAP